MSRKQTNGQHRDIPKLIKIFIVSSPLTVALLLRDVTRNFMGSIKQTNSIFDVKYEIKSEQNTKHFIMSKT